jgi:hypothetical protein
VWWSPTERKQCGTINETPKSLYINTICSGFFEKKRLFDFLAYLCGCFATLETYKQQSEIANFALRVGFVFCGCLAEQVARAVPLLMLF